MTASRRPVTAVRVSDGTLAERPIAGARALRFEAFVSAHIDSLNVSQRRHWSKNAAAKKLAERCLRIFRPSSAIADGFRFVKLTSYRVQLITDHDNLVGGAKQMRDAIKTVGLIIDDSDAHCYFDYCQELAKKSPTGKPGTLVQVYSP